MNKKWLHETIWLRITSWRGTSIGAVHYYGKLMPWDGDPVDLKRSITAQEAARLNKLHSCKPGTMGAYVEGQIYNGFNSTDEINALAIATYRRHFPKAKRLVLGDPVYECHKGVLHETENRPG